MRRYLIPILHLSIFIAAASLAAAQPAPPPVNPNATPEARALLAYIDSISGQGTLTGQHNFPNDGSRWTDLAYDLTGKYPALFGQDFGFSAGNDKDSVLSRPAMIEEVERQYRNGAVIALTWHAVPPTRDEPVTFSESILSHLTDYEWQQLLTPGTPLYNRWCAQVDVIAGYLRQLRDAHVPVLFRPYHEMSGNWFWWGGRPGNSGSAALYRQLYDRFVNLHHLDNLVWVWNVNAPGGNAGPIADYYPGPQFADLLTIDIYGEFKQEFYESMVALAAGKPVALAEVGKLPSPAILDRQPRWAYFMTWSEFIQHANSQQFATEVFHAPRAINRDDPRQSIPMANFLKATADRTGGLPTPHPVTPDPTPAAAALLVRLTSTPASPLLSGRLSGRLSAPASPAGAAAADLQAQDRQPTLYTGTLGLGDDSAILQQALQAHAHRSEVSLAWLPARPTDGAPAATHGKLTDFEWNELLTPGSALHQRWLAQVDQLAQALGQLQTAGVPVLWNPLPDSNANDDWWAGRKGVQGSAELYRQLFDRLVHHHNLRNLLWVWQAEVPGFGPAGPGAFSDFFPGYLFTDALQIRIEENNPDLRIPDFLPQFALGKPIGAVFTGNPPSPENLPGRPALGWFLVAPPNPSSSATPSREP